MEAYTVSIVPKIEADYEKLTGVERLIADFFIKNKEKMDFSSRTIAQKLHVSEASLSRFAKKLGYRGYREFIYSYQPAVARETGAEPETMAVLDAYREILHKSYSLIREDQIKRVASLIAEKKRIFLYGFGSSGLAAQEFKLRLMRVGMDVEAVTESHQLMINGARVSEDCLIIGISLSGATKEVVQAMEHAAAKGAKTVFITSSGAAGQGLFDETVLVAVKKNLQYGNVISPQFPTLVILDLIYASLLKEKARGPEEQYDIALWERIKGYPPKEDIP